MVCFSVIQFLKKLKFFIFIMHTDFCYENLFFFSQIPLVRKLQVGTLHINCNSSETIIDNLIPGSKIYFQLESCFGTAEVSPVSEISQANSAETWTRAPPASPKLLVTNISQEEFELSWNRPVLLDLGFVLFIKKLIYFKCHKINNFDMNKSDCIRETGVRRDRYISFMK